MSIHFNNRDRTLSEGLVKFIDYGSEEYIKQLVSSVTTKKLAVMDPYVGVVTYPSSDFLTGTFAYQKSVQFQDTLYIGYMDMLLPDSTTLVNDVCAYTRLTFKLDGILREFLQVQNPHADNRLGVQFFDFMMRTYPRSNRDIAFNRNAIHTLEDIEISGGVYQIGDGHGGGAGFVPVSSGQGSFTPAIEFEIAVSGYKCIAS